MAAGSKRNMIGVSTIVVEYKEQTDGDCREDFWADGIHAQIHESSRRGAQKHERRYNCREEKRVRICTRCNSIRNLYHAMLCYVMLRPPFNKTDGNAMRARKQGTLIFARETLCKSPTNWPTIHHHRHLWTKRCPIRTCTPLPCRLVTIQTPPQIPRPAHQLLILMLLHLQLPLSLDANGVHLLAPSLAVLVPFPLSDIHAVQKSRGDGRLLDY
jgi:hypothetical protein